jgi:hypothetical protein
MPAFHLSQGEGFQARLGPVQSMLRQALAGSFGCCRNLTVASSRNYLSFSFSLVSPVIRNGVIHRPVIRTVFVGWNKVAPIAGSTADSPTEPPESSPGLSPFLLPAKEPPPTASHSSSALENLGSWAAPLHQEVSNDWTNQIPTWRASGSFLISDWYMPQWKHLGATGHFPRDP